MMSRSVIINKINKKLDEKYEPLIKKMIQLEAFKNLDHYNINIKITLEELKELANQNHYIEPGHQLPNGEILDDATIAQINIARMFITKDAIFFKVRFAPQTS